MEKILCSTIPKLPDGEGKRNIRYTTKVSNLVGLGDRSQPRGVKRQKSASEGMRGEVGIDMER